MLDTSFKAEDVSAGTLGRDDLAPAAILSLLSDIRRSIEDDPRLAIHHLDRVAGLLEGIDKAARCEQAIVAAWPVRLHDSPQKGGLAPWQLKRVKAYIDRALRQTITVEDLARLVRLSAGHFCRAFKTSVGETPHAFIVRTRIRRAQTLMLDTNDTLSQIACACGLTDQAHLTRLFRRVAGTTPMAWRRAWQQPD